jgi:hypothetical protein
MAVTTPMTGWIFDSGCSRHYTGNRGLLNNIHTLPLPLTTSSASSTSTYNEEGDAQVMLSNNECIVFHDVALVNDFNVNLASVSKICDCDSEVLFTKTEARVMHR